MCPARDIALNQLASYTKSLNRIVVWKCEKNDFTGQNGATDGTTAKQKVNDAGRNIGVFQLERPILEKL